MLVVGVPDGSVKTSLTVKVRKSAKIGTLRASLTAVTDPRPF